MPRRFDLEKSKSEDLETEEVKKEATSSSIHDPRSAILHDSRAFVFIRGLNISARVGAAGRVALPAKETRLQEARFKRRSRIPWRPWRLGGEDSSKS